MKAGLKFFLCLSDGTCSRFVDSPEELIEACEKSGRLGEIYATWIAPELYARIKGVLELERSDADSRSDDQASSSESEEAGPSGSMPKKTRRATRVTKADQVSGPAGILSLDGADSES